MSCLCSSSSLARDSEPDWTWVKTVNNVAVYSGIYGNDTMGKALEGCAVKASNDNLGAKEVYCKVYYSYFDGGKEIYQTKTIREYVGGKKQDVILWRYRGVVNNGISISSISVQ